MGSVEQTIKLGAAPARENFDPYLERGGHPTHERDGHLAEVSALEPGHGGD
ncbi:MAG: hypothetical protein M3P14_08610 [Chloroflexota bacterium]|nr:hypothetical protein [Chloroflexota bacterium]